MFSFFSLFIEKRSCFRLAHFNILLLAKKKAGSKDSMHKNTYTNMPFPRTDVTLQKWKKLAPFIMQKKLLWVSTIHAENI